MSETKNRIQSDLKEAMKARDQHKVTNLRGLMAAVKQYEVDTRNEANEEKVIDIIQKEIKMRRDALQFATEQKRDDLIAQNESELALLQSYLGEQLNDDELRALIQAMIDQGTKAIGQIMGSLNKDYKGKFEGKKASEIAKSLLG